MTRKQPTTKQAEQAKAKAFLDFVDRVALALCGCVYEDCSPSQRKIVLAQVEALHVVQIN